MTQSQLLVRVLNNLVVMKKRMMTPVTHIMRPSAARVTRVPALTRRHVNSSQSDCVHMAAGYRRALSPAEMFRSAPREKCPLRSVIWYLREHAGSTGSYIS